MIRLNGNGNRNLNLLFKVIFKTKIGVNFSVDSIKLLFNIEWIGFQRNDVQENMYYSELNVVCCDTIQTT